VIRTLWAGLNLLIATFVIALAVVVAGPFTRNATFYRAASTYWARWVLWSSAVRVRLIDAEYIALDRPQVIVSNHTSWYDVFALAAYLPKRYRFIAKIELSRIPLFGRAWLRAGHIAVDRRDHAAAMQSMDRAAAAIRADNSAIVIFPEGTRSATGELLPFKKGGFIVALHTGAELVPCAVIGSRAILPKGGWRVRSGEITIRFARPVTTDGYTHDDRDLLIQRVRGEIAALLSTSEPSAD
jgi:1-acyl-sn-glycerol-3-phosphate acyltransferase